MTINSRVAGIGALAFGVLPLTGAIVGAPPGGDYSPNDVADFLAKSHRPAVFVSMYLAILSGVGLLLLLARLRQTIAGDRTSTFWGLGIASVSAWVIGGAIVVSPSTALTFSGGHLATLPAPVAYALSEAGWAVMYGGGGVLLGCALVTYLAGATAVPAWTRWATGVAALCSLVAVAWFPFFLVYLWAIVTGIWLIVRERSSAPAVATA